MDMTETTRDDDLSKAVDATVGDLIRVRHRDRESFIHLPFFYPSGAGTTLSIAVEGSGYRVSDVGFAYQEAAMVGAGDAFVRAAKEVGEKFGIRLMGHTLTSLTSLEQLAAAVSDVAAASAEAAQKIVSSANSSERKVASNLLERLGSLFQPAEVRPAPKFLGASSREWDITAIVKTASKITAFKAVGNQAASVYYSIAAMQDISLLSEAPHVVSVVDSISEMGSLYKILAQNSDVLEKTASNESFLKAAAA